MSDQNEYMANQTEWDRRKHPLTQKAWLKIILGNIVSCIGLWLVLEFLGVTEPFKYALIVSIGVFIFSAIITSNIRRARPWSRFNWE